MSLTDINIREKDFHNKLQSKKKGRFENIFYKAIYNSSEDFFKYLKNYAKNSFILDYGCGVGSFVKKVAEYNPEKITGIDISEVSIEKAKKNTRELKIKTEFKVENCEKTSFHDNSFDVVYGSGIIHHLQIEKSLDEILRILKPDGNLLFIEPLGTNPIINLYRKLTPKARSIDEHPLVKKDLDYIKKKFVDIKIKYYGFLTLVFFLFYKSPKNSKFFYFLASLDQFLFRFKIFKLFAWSVLITAKKN